MDRDCLTQFLDEHTPPLPREERVREVLEQRTRTTFADRNKTYSLRDSEIHTLSEVGKFRVVDKNDLAEFAYNRDRSRMENDVENLVRQGLAKVTAIADTDYNPAQVAGALVGTHVFDSSPSVRCGREGAARIATPR